MEHFYFWVIPCFSTTGCFLDIARKNFREKTKPYLENCVCLSDGGYTVQFQTPAIQQIALHAHEKSHRVALLLFNFEKLALVI